MENTQHSNPGISITGESTAPNCPPVVFVPWSGESMQGPPLAEGRRAHVVGPCSGAPCGLSGWIVSIGLWARLRIPVWSGGPSYSLWRPTWLQTSAGCQGACIPSSTWSSQSTCSVDRATKTTMTWRFFFFVPNYIDASFKTAPSTRVRAIRSRGGGGRMEVCKWGSDYICKSYEDPSPHCRDRERTISQEWVWELNTSSSSHDEMPE